MWRTRESVVVAALLRDPNGFLVTVTPHTNMLAKTLANTLAFFTTYDYIYM
jgi:hypothetical protein